MANAVCSSTHTQQLSRSKTTLWAVWGRQAAREARTKDCREAESPPRFRTNLAAGHEARSRLRARERLVLQSRRRFCATKRKAWSWSFGSQERRHRCNVSGGAARDASEASVSPASQQCSPRVLKARQHCVHVHVLFGVACCPHDPSARKGKRPTFPCVKKYSFIFFLVCARSLGVCVLDLYHRQAPFFFFFAPTRRPPPLSSCARCAKVFPTAASLDAYATARSLQQCRESSCSRVPRPCLLSNIYVALTSTRACSSLVFFRAKTTGFLQYNTE